VKFLILVIAAAVYGSVCAAEKDYVRHHCILVGGHIEYRLPDRTRVDCLTADNAIEFDWAYKWGECIGQAMYYGAMTDRRPMCALIVGPSDQRFIDRIETVARRLWSIDLWLISRSSLPRNR